MAEGSCGLGFGGLQGGPSFGHSRLSVVFLWRYRSLRLQDQRPDQVLVIKHKPQIPIEDGTCFQNRGSMRPGLTPFLHGVLTKAGSPGWSGGPEKSLNLFECAAEE